jgi:hypothetical protein
MRKGAEWTRDEAGHVHFVNPADCDAFSKKQMAIFVFLILLLGSVLYVIFRFNYLMGKWIMKHAKRFNKISRFGPDSSNRTV